MQRTILHIVSLTALLLGAAAAILFGALSRSMASEDSPQPLKPLQTPPTQTTGLVVTFEVPEDAADVLPGERVKFRVSVENPTDRPQTSLYVGVVVSHNPEALEYVDSSAFASYGDRTRKPLPATLDKRGTTVDETFDPGERVEVEWEMTVSECAVRDRWVQVVFLARTDEHDIARAFKNLYLYPHTGTPTHHFTPSYHVDPQTPAPGDAVRHTVRVVNDGYMALDNVVIQVNGHKTIDRYLPTIAENSSYYVVPRRGDEGTPPDPVKPGWSGADTGFNLTYLNPGQTLVLSWVDYVASDAPVDTVVRPRVNIRPDQANAWAPRDAQLTISRPANGLSISIRSIDPEYLAPFYLPGDRVTMRVIVTNHTATERDDLHVDLDLPFALSYVPGSTYLCADRGDGDDGCDAIYTVPPYQDGNARRLPDAWLDMSASLPSLRPGGTAAITFRAVILEDAQPQQGIALRATLRSVSRSDEHHATTRLDIIRRAEINMTVDGPATAEGGDEVRYEVSIENVGQADLRRVAFGIEETCSVTYVPGTLEITLPSGETVQDDSFMTYQRRDLDDATYPIGDLAASTPNGPSNEAKVSLTLQIADDVDPGNIAGPRFIVNADNSGPVVAGTENVRLRGIREETEIEVVESFVTEETFEAWAGRILGEIRELTTQIDETTSDTNLQAAETAELVDKATELQKEAVQGAEVIMSQAKVIEATAQKTNDLAETILGEVGEVKPWNQNAWWIIEWMGFGAVASLIAGIVLPFTLVGIWRRWRQRRATDPDLLGPPMPSKWTRSTLWATDRYRAGATLLATARRGIRDWIDGLWRR